MVLAAAVPFFLSFFGQGYLQFDLVLVVILIMEEEILYKLVLVFWPSFKHRG
jgi:hypothetical protein